MKQSGLHIFARALVVLAMAFQSLLPAGLALANDAGYDVSAFMCGPDGSQASAEAQAHFDKLMDLIGEDAPADTPDEICSDCVLSYAAVLPSLDLSAAPAIYLPRETPFNAHADIALIFARGPPLGGRAPPHLS